MEIFLINLRAQYLSIKKEIDNAIKSVLTSAKFILEENVEEFEKEFAKFCKVKYAVGVGNGTTALYLALRACGIGKGDEVITVPNTFIATVEAITLNGAKPVFVDIDPNTYNIDVNKIKRAITKKTKAIIIVHLYGQPADMDPILKIAKKYKIKIIEDCAQAHGAEYKGERVGNFGHAACFSFFPGKNLGAYGDGGIIVSNNKKIAEIVKILRNHGRKEKYKHQVQGINSRLDELQAAILRVKLRHLNRWNKARGQRAKSYDKALKNIQGLEVPSIPFWAISVYYVYTIKAKKRNKLQKALKKQGISTGIYYPIPLHLQPALRYLGYKRGDFLEAEKAAKEILSLPICPHLTKKNQDFITKKIKEFFSKPC